jgi:hypothetical protein
MTGPKIVSPSIIIRVTVLLSSIVFIVVPATAPIPANGKVDNGMTTQTRGLGLSVTDKIREPSKITVNTAGRENKREAITMATINSNSLIGNVA